MTKEPRDKPNKFKLAAQRHIVPFETNSGTIKSNPFPFSQSLLVPAVADAVWLSHSLSYHRWLGWSPSWELSIALGTNFPTVFLPRSLRLEMKAAKVNGRKSEQLVHCAMTSEWCKCHWNRDAERTETHRAEHQGGQPHPGGLTLWGHKGTAHGSDVPSKRYFSAL